MAYQTIKSTGYGQRVSGSSKGIVSGFLMLLFGTVLLFWNEGSFVRTKKALQEAESVLVHVKDVSNVDPALNGQLIHASAFADTKEVLTDELFGVSEMAIAISRKEEYYQYVEKSTTEKVERIGGREESVISYTYEKKWTSSPENSANFHEIGRARLNSSH